MNDTPLVSIIIPVYNVEKYLPQCLDSVVRQTYKNIEVILINDGSPDGSDAICQEYHQKYSQIQYFKRDNCGVDATRNYGMKIAKGEFFFFLDSDDYLEDNCIEIMVEVAKTGRLVATGYKIDDMGKGEVSVPPQSCGSYDTIESFLNDFHKYFATKFNFIWGKLYRRDIIEANNILFDEDMSLSEDLLFNLDYFSYCNDGIILLEDNGYYYRQSDSSTLSKRFNPRMFEWNEKAYITLRDYLLKYNALTEQNKVHFYTNVLGNLLYSTELLSLQDDIPLKKKAVLIKEYSSTTLSQETFRFADINDFRSRFMVCLLKYKMITLYIMITQLMTQIKKIIK